MRKPTLSLLEYSYPSLIVASSVAISAGGLLILMPPHLSALILGSLFIFLGLAFPALRAWRCHNLVKTIQTTIHTQSIPYLLTDRKGKPSVANTAFHTLFPDGLDTALETMKHARENTACLDHSHPDTPPKTLWDKKDSLIKEMSLKANLGDHGVLNLISCIPLPFCQKHMLWRVDSLSPWERYDGQQFPYQPHYDQEISNFIQEAPVGFYALNSQGHFSIINPQFAQWLGARPEDIINSHYQLEDFLMKDKKHIAQNNPAPLHTDKQNRRITLRNQDGNPLHAHIFHKTLFGENTLTWGMVYDVTQEVELEKALRETMHRFQKLFHAAPTGIALLDLDGQIIEYNNVMYDLLGRPKDIKGRSIHTFTVPEDQEKFTHLIEVLVKKNEAQYDFEAQLPSPHGQEKRVGRFFASRMESDTGTISGLILHGLDTTEQKKLETQFTQSQKMQAVGQLAGGIAHDFNNLLTAMLGFCDLLLQRHQPGEQSFADIMQIKQNANRAANLVRQLLAFSRQQPVKPKRLDLTDILADISHLLRRLIGETIVLEIKHGRDIDPVFMDQSQLEQVIINLAVNARDAMPKGGVLTIETEMMTVDNTTRKQSDMPPKGEYILIQVSDTGSGINVKDLDRIFEPFYSTKAVGSGTGLGLSTVEGIIRQSGGYIFVASQLGQGTAFRIYLPRHTPPKNPVKDTENLHKTEQGDLTGAGTILLAEDEGAVRLFSARALRSKGYHVLEASSGRTAIELLKQTQEPVDLLITDVVMPDMDGPALIDWIRKNRPGMRIICISGYAEESIREKISRNSDILFLSKPFTLNELAGVVKKILHPETKEKS